MKYEKQIIEIMEIKYNYTIWKIRNSKRIRDLAAVTIEIMWLYLKEILMHFQKIKGKSKFL